MSQIIAALDPPGDVSYLVRRGAEVAVSESLTVLDEVGEYFQTLSEPSAGVAIRHVDLDEDELADAVRRCREELAALVSSTPELTGWRITVEVEPDDDEDEDDEDLDPVTSRVLPTGDELLEELLSDIRDEAALLRTAAAFRAFPVDQWVDEADERTQAAQRRQATNLAACLMVATHSLTDELFGDIERLRAHDVTTLPQDDLLVLDWLPSRYAHRYTALFAQRFLVALTDVTLRFTKGWEPLACVAQELGLRLLLNQAEVIADTYELALPEGWRGQVENLLFEDLDHEYLYDPADDGMEEDPDGGPPGMAPMDFDLWFTPFDDERTLPPYALPG